MTSHNRAQTAEQPDLAAKRLADYSRAVVDALPPLTDEQARRLSVLLNSTEAA